MRFGKLIWETGTSSASQASFRLVVNPRWSLVWRDPCRPARYTLRSDLKQKKGSLLEPVSL